MGTIRLYDCDTHFTDHTTELWRELALEEPELPTIVEEDGSVRLRLAGRLFPKPAGAGQGNPKGLGHLIGAGEDADRAEFMAKHQIAAAVLQPGFVGLSVQAIEDTAHRQRILRGYNQLAAAACARSSVELRWAILVSAEDPQWSLDALAEHAADESLVAAVIRPTARTAAHRLNDSNLTPLLEALARRQLPLMVHGGTGCYQWSPLADGYADYAMTHAFGHMGEQMVALADLLTRSDGLPDALRIILLESGISWIPALLGRLSSHVRRLGSGGRGPAEVFGQHFAVVPDPDEPHVLWAVRELGSEAILFGSDYPHWDTVEAPRWLDQFQSVVTPAKLEENTARIVPRLHGVRT